MYRISMLALLVVVCLVVVTGCHNLSLKLATPFKVMPDAKQQERYLVVVTYTQYNTNDGNQARFKALTDGVVASLENAEGLYGYSIRKDFLGNTAWTYTIWENDKAKNQFKVTGGHLNAMRDASNVLKQAKFARTIISAESLNYSWDSALALLESDGSTYDYSSSTSNNQRTYRDE